MWHAILLEIKKKVSYLDVAASLRKSVVCIVILYARLIFLLYFFLDDDTWTSTIKLFVYIVKTHTFAYSSF